MSGNNSRQSPSAKQVSTETKSVQTIQAAFVPCESCAKVQHNLKLNADLLINMCHYQNITSQVGKFRANLMSTEQLVGDCLSGDDLEKWLTEQDKDLVRINRQLEFLSKNNELLQGKLKDSEVKRNYKLLDFSGYVKLAIHKIELYLLHITYLNYNWTNFGLDIFYRHWFKK